VGTGRWPDRGIVRGDGTLRGTMGSGLDVDALRAARLAKGLTQEQLGRAVGVAAGNRISDWENGRATPHPGHLRRLAVILDVPVSALLRPVSEAERDLRRLRLEAGLSIDDVAKRIHVATPTLKRWESGVVRRLVARAPVDQLAEALGVEEADVVAALQRTRAGWPEVDRAPAEDPGDARR
jgi:transcriptional regulator with XRE-family HTH domain